MKRKVLIVEDYAGVRNFMKFLVESYGYQVTEARDGQKAIESVTQEQPDLILMDLSMPIMDGVTATRIIREFEGMSELPIIAVTAHEESFSEQAIEAGCNDLLNKPLDFSALEPILSQYLNK